MLLDDFDLDVSVLVTPYPFNVDLEALELKTLVVPLSPLMHPTVLVLRTFPVFLVFLAVFGLELETLCILTP